MRENWMRMQGRRELYCFIIIDGKNINTSVRACRGEDYKVIINWKQKKTTRMISKLFTTLEEAMAWAERRTAKIMDKLA